VVITSGRECCDNAITARRETHALTWILVSSRARSSGMAKPRSKIRRPSPRTKGGVSYADYNIQKKPYRSKQVEPARAKAVL
jgi:hypothetical protein